MAFPKKKGAKEVYKDLVQEEQLRQAELVNSSSSDEAKTALDRLNELQRNFKAAQEQGCFSDKFLRQITDINELFDWFVAHVKEAVGIETAAIQYMAAYNACERGIAEKKQETEQILKDLDVQVSIKERELNSKLENLKVEISTLEASLDASKKQQEASITVELDTFRKQLIYNAQREAQTIIDKAKEDIANQWSNYRDKVKQLEKDTAEAAKLQESLTVAKEKASQAYDEGFKKGKAEESVSCNAQIKNIESSYSTKLQIANAKLQMADEQIASLKQQLNEANTNLANTNAKLVEMATAQFKQPTQVTK